ncbi:MAG: photosystem I assembly protein Ycf4, partial [Cyanobium sp.]
MASRQASAAGSPSPRSSSDAKAAAASLVLEQSVLGSRRLSNLLVATAVSLGGVGFLLASASSRFGRDLLPVGHP